jgi:alpha-tubulin suppressor-like RCC1 family protein
LSKSCGLTAAGLLKCSLGDESQELVGLSVEVDGLPSASLEVAVNRFGSLIMALTENGVPIAFRANKSRTISGVSDATDVDSGLGHTCVLLNDGRVNCWGSNYYGQLGNNSQTSTADPQLVRNISGAWQIAVGKHHACALIPTDDPLVDEIRCWGFNKDGQLGNGTNLDSTVPVSVLTSR